MTAERNLFVDDLWRTVCADIVRQCCVAIRLKCGYTVVHRTAIFSLTAGVPTFFTFTAPRCTAVRYTPGTVASAASNSTNAINWRPVQDLRGERKLRERKIVSRRRRWARQRTTTTTTTTFLDCGGWGHAGSPVRSLGQDVLVLVGKNKDCDGGGSFS